MESEKATEAYLRERVKALGGKAYKFVSPGNVGVPDRLIVLPKGRVFFAEIKSPKGVLTANQKHQLNGLDKLGHRCYVLRSREEVDVILEDWAK